MTSIGRPVANRNASPIAPSSLDFPVVGIGASAGGLRSLLRFFRAAPERPGMAYVIILHLSPRHESNAAEVIQGVTAMPVTKVTSATPIEANHVYVIPPNRQLLMNDGYLRLTEPQRPRGRHVTVDLFFRALAEAHGNKAYALVLSGTGSDGSLGLRTIKEAGGVTIAERPEDAEYDGMPRSAIATGAVDVVLPVEEMPDKLVELWDNARSIGALGGGDPDEAVLAQPLPGGGQGAQEALRDVIVTLREQTGHDFRHYKRATVLRRIERRMQVTGTKNLPGYRDYVRTNLSETTSLLRDMLIGVTSFFRDTDAFEVLEREAIPRIFEARPAGEQVRAWVAGCATGEEAYSLGMLLCDFAAQQEKPPAVQIFATDIDDTALAIGRSGMYPSSIATDLSPARLRHYFAKEGEAYRVRKGLRDHVLFALHNVLRDPPFSRLDLVSCRNLLIYLDREAQSDVLEMFHFALQPNGYLFLGSSESADAASHLFTPVDKKSRLYRARPVARGGRYAPSLPLGKHDARAVSEVAGVPERRRAASFGDLHRRALEQHAPPSVVVNHDSDIVHISEQAGRYLRYVGGEPTHNLVALVLPELRLELRTALFEAIQSGKPVERRRAQISRDGRNYNVSMMTRPFRDPETGAEFVLVMFDEVEAPKPADPGATPDSKHDAMVAQLENELQRTKEQLQATIEQAETSTEELKASNEELQAINEELRSATEELETSKEELQSINEELITVNHELKSKVEETGKINDDLQNLIASTNIGTVFVDGNLRIKRFTPRATEIFSIIPTDVGRSLLDITHRLNYDHLSEDVAETFESLRMIERDVRSSDGHWYIARIVPYRTTEDRIEGAVLISSTSPAARPPRSGCGRARSASAWCWRAPRNTPSSRWTRTAASPPGTRAPSGTTATPRKRCWGVPSPPSSRPMTARPGCPSRNCAAPARKAARRTAAGTWPATARAIS